jgi:hypothetical protein
VTKVIICYLFTEDVHRHRKGRKVGKVKLGDKGIAYLDLNAYAMPLEACMLVYVILIMHLHDV